MACWWYMMAHCKKEKTSCQGPPQRFPPPISGGHVSAALWISSDRPEHRPEKSFQPKAGWQHHQPQGDKAGWNDFSTTRGLGLGVPEMGVPKTVINKGQEVWVSDCSKNPSKSNSERHQILSSRPCPDHFWGNPVRFQRKSRKRNWIWISTPGSIVSMTDGKAMALKGKEIQSQGLKKYVFLRWRLGTFFAFRSILDGFDVFWSSFSLTKGGGLKQRSYGWFMSTLG